jgi:hypothetical protein
MTDPAPRAPAAVPEAVSTAMSAYSHAVIVNEHAQLSEHSSRRERDDLSDARLDAWNELVAAIATALREATETRDQEIAKLKVDLDVARQNYEIIHNSWVGMQDTDELRQKEMAERDQEIARLTAELEAARDDTALIDWADAHRAGVWHLAEVKKWASRAGRNFATLRAALRAARDR